MDAVQTAGAFSELSGSRVERHLSRSCHKQDEDGCTAAKGRTWCDVFQASMIQNWSVYSCYIDVAVVFCTCSM
ncbi:unnamed protein product [Amoebophrya sp. A25]|nr:unnamed protein product [Amoebophrya sp. A25]|eukprot:GSA25T00014050001.1